MIFCQAKRQQEFLKFDQKKAKLAALLPLWPNVKRKIKYQERYDKENERLKVHSITYVYLSNVRCQVEAVSNSKMKERHMHTLNVTWIACLTSDESGGGARGGLGGYNPLSEPASPPSEGETRFFRRFLAFIVP